MATRVGKPFRTRPYLMVHNDVAITATQYIHPSMHMLTFQPIRWADGNCDSHDYNSCARCNAYVDMYTFFPRRGRTSASCTRFSSWNERGYHFQNPLRIKPVGRQSYCRLLKASYAFYLKGRTGVFRPSVLPRVSREFHPFYFCLLMGSVFF